LEDDDATLFDCSSCLWKRAGPSLHRVGAKYPGRLSRITPDKLTWKPNARVPGVDAADLLGQADKQAPYVQRIKFPANFKVMPHTHPEERAYTIISGTWYVGWGETFDEGKLLALPPGSFYTEPANVAHFVGTKADPVVVQISGTGPTATKMLDAKK
jgi:quercetin dioxygenase-like cupin family protein